MTPTTGITIGVLTGWAAVGILVVLCTLSGRTFEDVFALRLDWPIFALVTALGTVQGLRHAHLSRRPA